MRQSIVTPSKRPPESAEDLSDIEHADKDNPDDFDYEPVRDNAYADRAMSDWFAWRTQEPH